MALCPSVHQLLLLHHHHSHSHFHSLPPFLSTCITPLSRSISCSARTPSSVMVHADSQTANAAALTDVDQKQQALASKAPCPPLQLTYLEGNSWLWSVLGMQVLVDPVLVGNLDFGIPWLYDAAKKELKEFQLDDLPELDLLLITQNFDDHCHEKTLRPLSTMFPDLQVVATLNAQPTLSKLFKKVIYLEPGHSTVFRGSNGSEVVIRASAGPTLGPPWQRPENGYFLEAKDLPFTLYYEPHCVYDRSLLHRERADVVITPVIKQVLPLYTLVSGQRDAVDLVKLLQAKFVIPLHNGDLESKGILSKLVSTVGTVEDFKEILKEDLPSVRVLEAKPGIPLDVPVAS